VNSLPKTVTRQRRDCDLNTGPSAPESSTLTTRLPSHPGVSMTAHNPPVPHAASTGCDTLYRCRAITRDTVGQCKVDRGVRVCKLIHEIPHASAAAETQADDSLIAL